MGFCKRLSPSKTNFNGNFMSRRYKWPFVGYTILALSPSIIQLYNYCGVVMSVLSHSLRERENQDLAPTMNAIVVHSKLVDSFEETLIQHADMSFLWYVR